VDPKSYKSYEELETKMREVLLGSATGGGGYRSEESSFSKKERSVEPKTNDNEPVEDDDDMAYFRKLAQSM